MSQTKEYGPTDLGEKGICTFFARHRCNHFCRPHWNTPEVMTDYYKLKKGTSMALPVKKDSEPIEIF
jgi:hypothetical protein